MTETDGVVSLSAGSNVITVEVTAEDGQTMRTYSVTVTRPVSDNAYLIFLTLSSIAIEHGSTFYPPGFSGLVFNYAPSVAHSLTETTVTPTVAHSFATYIIKLDGVTDADGVIALSVGRNVITIEVTAEDGETTKTYTITVTRAPAPMTDATLKSLLLSGIDIGSGMGIGKIVPTYTSYTVSVYHSVSQTTVTPTVNHSGASYVIKLGGVEDADGTISLAVGSNVITVEVTAEDDSTTKTYTVTVNRATASAPTTGELSTDDPPVNFRATDVFSDHTIIVLSFPRNRGITGWVLQRYEHDGDEFVSSGSAMRSEFTGSKDIGGEGLRVGNSEVEPGALYKWVAQLTNSQGSTVIETFLTVRIPSDETTELSSDATLSGLTLSGVDFGTFASGTTSYTASVANSVSHTTVTPTVNHSGASYVIKLDGVEGADGMVSLSVGSNVITVEVTAEDDSTTQTYTVTVTRAAPPSTDATLSALTLSGIDFGTFDSTTMSYTASVANSVSQTTVTPTVNHSGASYVIKHSGVTDEDGTIALSVGSNGITVEVTAEDGQTKRTYSITITRSASSDATLEYLDLSGIDIGDGIGRRGTYVGNQTSFNASVYHSISQTTVTPTVKHPGASYVVKLEGVEDADRSISLAVGSNVITIEVTAEDDSTTQTYTATVNRATASAPTTGELSTDAPPVNFRAIYVSKTFAGFALSYPRNRGLFGWVGQRYEHDGDSFVSSGADSRYEFSDSDDLGGSRLEFGDENIEPGALYKWVAMLTNSQGSTVIETSVTVRIPPDETTELSSDATLSDLTLTGMELQKTGGLHAEVAGFASSHLSYAAGVAYSLSQTTVAPTVNHSGTSTSYVIKLDGVTDEDGVISLSVGSNIITVEVTAEDGETTQTYTVAVTRAAALSTDATLNGLTLSGVDFGTFASGTTSYTASVANSVSQTTVTPTVNDPGASYVIRLGGVTDTDGVVSLRVGSNDITVEVTAEDDSTAQTYTVTVTREGLPTEETEAAIPHDTNNNGVIDKSEMIKAFRAYIAGDIDKAQIISTFRRYIADAAG